MEALKAMWFIQFQLNIFDKVNGIGVKKRLLSLGNGQNLGEGRMSQLRFFFSFSLRKSHESPPSP